MSESTTSRLAEREQSHALPSAHLMFKRSKRASFQAIAPVCLGAIGKPEDVFRHNRTHIAANASQA